MRTTINTLVAIQNDVYGTCQNIVCHLGTRALLVVDLARDIFARLAGRPSLRCATVPVCVKRGSVSGGKAAEGLLALHLRSSWRPMRPWGDASGSW